MPEFFLLPDIEERGHKFSKKHRLALEKAGKFPKRVYLGPKTPAWLKTEIIEHEEKIIVEQREAGTDPDKRLPRKVRKPRDESKAA